MAHPDEFKGPDADMLPDTATLPADLAALYLCMSPAQLAGLRKPSRPGSASSVIRPVEGGAAGSKDPAQYRLGTLRDHAKAHAAPCAFDAALKTGLPGWLTVKLPFFAEREPRVKRGRRVLIGGAWDRADPLREKRFVALAKGHIRFTSLTCAEAAASLWADLASHRALAETGLALLSSETQAIESSLVATSRLTEASHAEAADSAL